MGKKENSTIHSLSAQSLQNNADIKPLFNAWISPLGAIFEVDIGYHSNFVIDFIEKQFGKEYLLTMKLFSTQHMYDYLEEKGWIRVTNWRSGEFSFVFPKRVRIPRSQIKAVIDICLAYHIPVPHEIK